MSTLHNLWRRATGRGDDDDCRTVVLGAPPTRGRRRAADAAEIDPLVTLGVQVRLAELGAEVRRIEADPDVYARAHHWRAAVLAYDALLRDACLLAGIAPVSPPLPADADAPLAQQARLREELELSERGWSW
jgi:hypothetical protein